MGGGGKRLFRKKDDRSAEFCSDLNRVRRDGSYMYESYLPTMGTDVKVYTVGPFYAHAEARKSPTVDGRVHRQLDGKEVRYPVLLSTAEKEIARAVCLAFRQTVCGFDLLRSAGKSYVCDVNGWSFVKNSAKYYDDAAGVLRNTVLSALAPHMLALPSPLRGLRMPPAEAAPPPGSMRIPASQSTMSFCDSGSDGGGGAEELRCVIAVIRHGDRTPKQKLKLILRDEAFLRLYAEQKPRGARAEQVKLKSAEQLQGVLDACRDMLRRMEEGADCGVLPEDRAEKMEKLRAATGVLSRKSNDSGGQCVFSGINRKVQLKPVDVAPPAADAEPGAEPRVLELMLVVKHGGVLTHAGRAQCEALGSDFRRTVYPAAGRYDPEDASGEGAGLLRLHSTYRHDLKIWSSDEGRVQMSAAAFAKGLLDLEGTSLAPILVSLVNLNGFMLDSFDKGASEDIRAAKAAMSRYMTSSAAGTEDAAAAARSSGVDAAAGEWDERSSPRDSASPVPLSPSRSSATESEITLPDIVPGELGDAWASPPVDLLRQLVVHIQALREEIQERIWAAHGAAGSASPSPSPGAGAAAGGTAAPVAAAPSLGNAGCSGASPGTGPCSDESLFLLLERWRKLERGLYNTRKHTFDISKIPDIFDAVKYDALHSRHWDLSGLPKLHEVAKELADAVIPNGALCALCFRSLSRLI
jgi:inositol hexakisphosphate/diphosphoinositol-pentakisphosphate kinase